MKTLVLAAVLSTSIGLEAIAQRTSSAGGHKPPASKVSPYAVVGRDGNSRIWERIVNERAVSQFASASAAKYQHAFISIGANDLNSAMSQIGTVTMDYISDSEAEGYFTKTIDGQVITFPVNFVKENGVWKIFEF